MHSIKKFLGRVVATLTTRQAIGALAVYIAHRYGAPPEVIAIIAGQAAAGVVAKRAAVARAARKPNGVIVVDKMGDEAP